MKRLIAMTALFLIIVLQPVSGQTADRFLFQSAEQRFRSGDYTVALERYDQLLREHPSSELIPDVQFRRAVTYYQIGRYQDAVELFDRIQVRYRSTRFLQFVPYYQGLSHFQIGNYQQAVDILSMVQVRDDGLRHEARLYIIRSQIALGRTAAAADGLESLLRVSGLSPEIRGISAALYVSLLNDLEEYSEVISFIDSSDISAVPEEWRAQILLFYAEALFHEGFWEEAKELYETISNESVEIATVAFQRLFIIAQSGGNLEEVASVIQRAEQVLAGRSNVLRDFWLRVGLSSFQAKSYDIAELYLRRVWDLRGIHPVDAVVPLYLAELAELRGDVAYANSVLQVYLEQNMNDTVLFRLASLQAKSGNWESAQNSIAQFRTLYPSSPLFPQASYLHAYVFQQQGRHRETLGIIRDLQSRGLTSNLHQDLLRLEAQAHRFVGDSARAIDSFRDYLSLRPEDVAAAVEYITLLFEQDRFLSVEQEAGSVLERFPDLSTERPTDYAKLSYLRGLSAVTAADFEAAVQHFEPFSMIDPGLIQPDSDIEAMYPYNLFYHAWSHYQLGDFSSALGLFRRIISNHPGSAIAPRALYLAAWSAFADGNFAESENILRRSADFDFDTELAADVKYLLAQSLVEQRKELDALNAYRNVFADYSGSRRAQEARYGYAETLLRLERRAQAAEAFAAVHERYPDSYLGQDALFRQAELLYRDGEYRSVQEILFQYRTRYPDGNRIDEALYLGARSAEELTEPSGALLLWNRLVQEHRDSPYRFDAMMNAARLHRARAEYRSALNLVSEANSRYPEQSAAAGGQRIANELVLLVGGLSEREAELRVQIEQSGGAGSNDGRAAILELGRLLTYDTFEGEASVDRILPQLQAVSRMSGENADQAAEAHLLLGEYYFRNNSLERAAESFLEAASTVVSDRDLLARSLFRGAEVLVRDNRMNAARDLVDRIQQNFPQTQWSEAAGRLIKD
ncbi:tetratricopeptide repeat protein [Spirochaeta dissipatitropha]